MHGPLRAAASFVGSARVRGVLYRVDDYPGIVLDPGAGWVVGELYLLRDPAVLGRLDAYEGAGTDDPEPREFRRVRTTVEPLAGAPLSAWVYEYGRPTEGLPVIASGDFLEDTR